MRELKWQMNHSLWGFGRKADEFDGKTVNMRLTNDAEIQIAVKTNGTTVLKIHKAR